VCVCVCVCGRGRANLDARLVVTIPRLLVHQRVRGVSLPGLDVLVRLVRKREDGATPFFRVHQVIPYNKQSNNQTKTCQQ